MTWGDTGTSGWSSAHAYTVTYNTNTTNSYSGSSWDNSWGGTASYNTRSFRNNGTEDSQSSWHGWYDWVNEWNNARERTEEEIEADRQRREQRAEKRAEAKQRAQELLFSLLNREQRKEYMASNWFHVVASDGRLFQLKLGRQHNVFEVDVDGTKVREYCGHVGESVPDEDNLVAQMLLIQSDVAEFERVCNIWDLRNARRTVSRSGQPFQAEVAA